MARPDGVVIVSERYWAFAGNDGTLREGDMPQTLERVRRIPLARGLVKLAASLSPLLRRSGVSSPRERLFLVGVMLAPLLLLLLPTGLQTPAGLVLTVALLCWLLRGRTLRLHGAEHRSIAAVEARQLVATWEGEARPTRFSPRCGTNFAALVLPVTFGFQQIWTLPTTFLTPFAVTLVSLALTMELWQLVQRHRALRMLLWPGLVLQRLTTREPALADTRVALRAVDAVLRRELVI